MSNNYILQGQQHHIQKPPPNTSDIPTTIQSINPNAAPEPTMHKPLSSWPKTTSLTYDQLKQAFGFRQISHIVEQIKEVSERNFHISNHDSEPVLNLGDVASIPTPNRNSNPIPLPL